VTRRRSRNSGWTKRARRIAGRKTTRSTIAMMFVVVTLTDARS
jgi:hypothetical protein